MWHPVGEPIEASVVEPQKITPDLSALIERRAMQNDFETLRDLMEAHAL